MVNAPTRPSGRPRSDRRTPRGPRTVALSRKDEQNLAGIRAAADKLRSIDEAELAAFVDTALTPAHLATLKRAAWGDAPNLAIKMPKTLRDQIKARAAASNEKLAPIVDAAFTRFLSGEFVVEPPARRGWGSGVETAVLNVRPDADLHADVSARCRDLRDAGTHPGLYVSTVAAAALYEHYRIGPYAPDAETGTAS